MISQHTKDIANPISGEKLYQKRARQAFPLLVRQAKAGQKIYYSSLAEEIGMPNPRNLNYVLGAIGYTLINISKAWKEAIPPIQCLVVNKGNELPGEGINWFLEGKKDFSKLSSSERRKIVDNQLIRIYAYPKWSEVLSAVGLAPTTMNFREMNDAAKHEGMGGGESEEHRKLKEFVSNNPLVIGLPRGVPKGELEAFLPSGDSLDVSFHTESEWIAAEVKSRKSSKPDILRGLYQCVKYQAVMKALQIFEDAPKDVRAVLVLENKFPSDFIPLRNVLGITVFDGIKIRSISQK